MKLGRFHFAICGSSEEHSAQARNLKSKGAQPMMTKQVLCLNLMLDDEISTESTVKPSASKATDMSVSKSVATWLKPLAQAILGQALVSRALPFLFSHGCVEARWPLCRFGASGSARATLRTTATSLS